MRKPIRLTRRPLAALLVGMASLWRPAAAGDLLASTAASVTLPGSGASWGFATFDPARGQLLLARRDNGVTVFDTVRQQALRTLPGTAGANSIVLVPKADRAYIVYMDGTLGIMRLSDLSPLQRIRISEANLNNAVFEPVSGRVLIASGRRADHSTLYALDPALDRIVAERDVAIHKIDPLLVVGDGTVLVPMRDEGAVMRLEAATLAVRDTWRLDGCAQPGAMAADFGHRRLFVACRGGEPSLLVADLDTGAKKATLPIGHAVNAVAYDAGLARILVPSGIDASLRIVAQDDADHYRVLGDVATRVWAHNMAYDATRHRAYLMAMDATQAAVGPGEKKAEPLFHRDSFTVLSYQIE